MSRPVGADNNNNFQAPPMSPLAQRFAEAVRTLIGDGPVKVRLAQAYTANLADLADTEFPAALRRDYADLQAALSRVAPVGSESRVRASVQKMSPDEAGIHAATIVKLYVELLNTLERAEPLKVVSSPKKPPQYLTSRN
ncbi:MAG: hypothetical protein ABI640_04650 [Gammaproteobacteria bacterium]